MSTATSRIHCEVDFERDGKQTGFLRIPHSVHRSAYGWLPMPVVCVRNGDGPKVLIMAGNHGDEYEGQVALCKLARSLEPERIRGRVLMLPMTNYPAARAGRRTSPIDGGNLNRTFPGDADGTVTQMIAHFVEEVAMPGCELMMDIHSGGSSLDYVPSVQAEFEPEGGLAPRVRELAQAFGAPLTQVYAPGTENRMSEAAARRKGLTYFTTELGGAGTVSVAALRAAEHGISRVLHAVGCLREPDPSVPPASATRFVEVRADEHFVYASESGVYEPLVELGDEVRAGQPAAALHFPDTPWREPVIDRFRAHGLVICRRTFAHSERGDCLFHLGADWNG
jgi:predicted deacylase